jgi:membrane associated rhomboid family serine protease
MIIVAITGVLYLTEAVDTLLNGALDQDGIQPRQLNGLEGILWASLLHASWQHLVFGWFIFLLARGLFTRSPAQILLAVALFALWGSVLWGLLPGAPGISWQGHLFGAACGLLAAYLVVPADRTHADWFARPRLTGS